MMARHNFVGVGACLCAAAAWASQKEVAAAPDDVCQVGEQGRCSPDLASLLQFRGEVRADGHDLAGRDEGGPGGQVGRPGGACPIPRSAREAWEMRFGNTEALPNMAGEVFQGADTLLTDTKGPTWDRNNPEVAALLGKFGIDPKSRPGAMQWLTDARSMAALRMMQLSEGLPCAIHVDATLAPRLASELQEVNAKAAPQTCEIKVVSGKLNVTREYWKTLAHQKFHAAPLNAIAYPSTKYHVQLLVKLARRMQWQVTVVSGGHDGNDAGAKQGALLISTSKMAFLHVGSPDAMRTSPVLNNRSDVCGLFGGGLRPGLPEKDPLACSGSPAFLTAGAGIRLGEATQAMYADKFLMYSGLCSSNGLAGFSLAGGMSPMTRMWGMGVDQVVALEYVDPEGQTKYLIQQALQTEAEKALWWALLGGARAMLGVVTAFGLKIYPRRSSGCVFYKHMQYLFVNDKQTMLQAARSYACVLNNVDAVLGADSHKLSFRWAVMFTGKCDQNDPSTFPVGIRYEIFWMDSEPADSVKPMDSPFVRKTASLLDKCRVPHPEPPHVADAASTRTIVDNWEQELLFGIGGDAPAWSMNGPFPTQWECAASDYGCPGASGAIAARYHAGTKSDGEVGTYQMGAFWLSEVWQPDETAGDTMHSLFNYHPSAAFFEEMVHSFVGRGPHDQGHALSHAHFPRAFPDLYQRCDEVPAVQCGASPRYIDSMHQAGTDMLSDPSAPILMDQYALVKSNPFIDFAFCQAVVENPDSGRISAGLPNASSEQFAWKQGQVKEMTASANTLAALSLIAYRDALAAGASGAPRSYVGLDDNRFIVDTASSGYIGGLTLDSGSSVPDTSTFQVIRCPGFNRFYGSANAQRLAAMKRSIDPNDVFTQASADFRNMDKDGFFKRDSPEWNALQNRCPPWLNLQDDQGLSDDMLAHLEGYEPDFAFLQAAP